jgi:hypothetical protein
MTTIISTINIFGYSTEIEIEFELVHKAEPATGTPEILHVHSVKLLNWEDYESTKSAVYRAIEKYRREHDNS